jgi:RND family efflux transporter MFP subunit
MNINKINFIRLKALSYTIYLFSLSLMLVSCNSSKEESSEELAKRSYTDRIIQVQTTEAVKGLFTKELVSTGKLYAFKKAEIPFRISENITSITVKNGDRVKKGQLLATLEQFNQTIALDQAKNQMEKALNDMEDNLIGRGYGIKDTANMPWKILRSVRIESGYNTAYTNLKEAEYNFEATRLRAPFSGIISDLKAKVFNPASSYEYFCILIDDGMMDVEFNVMESEISQVRSGQKVQVFPFADPEKVYTGTITQINPQVDENGLIMVKATVKNSDLSLMDGMNVKILSKNKVPDQLIVPKEAVVLRQGREVVFTYEDGLAKWNYVKTGLENSTQFTITEGLSEGQKVIVSNNLNLAHETRVEIADI